ncbi:hypothetical protein SEEH3712_18242, partial [Salmonella enterica subsp. enterica serovar Heidelberg str. 622737-12]
YDGKTDQRLVHDMMALGEKLNCTPSVNFRLLPAKTLLITVLKPISAN